MKFYKENEVNPLASCLPLVAQLPVFIGAVLHAAHEPAAGHLPAASSPRTRHATRRAPRLGSAQRPTTARSACGADHGGAGFLFIPDLTNKATGAVADRPDPPLRRHAARLEPDDVDARRWTRPSGRYAAAAAVLRGLHHQLPGRPDRLLDHDEHWTMAQQYVIRRRIGPVAAGHGRPAATPAAARRRRPGRDGVAVPTAPGRGGWTGGLLRGLLEADRRRSRRRVGARTSRGVEAPPPPPPRKKKKRSGRRR